MRLLLALLTALALALASCGGDDDSSSDSSSGADNGAAVSDEDQITATVEAFAKGDDSSCDALTDQATEDLFGGRDACEEAASDENDSAEVDVTDIEVNGDSATAKGTSEGDTLDITLEKDGDDWKISGFEQAK